MDQHDSSNSGGDEQSYKLGFKKINFSGEISDSQDSSHSSQSNYKGSDNKVKRNNYSKQISHLLKQEQNENGIQDQKTKLIKKNCMSAKMSRQRKKFYIELLQKKVETLKHSIINTRQRLKDNRSKIMQYIQQSNKQKRVYIEEKMKDSKRLITMSEEFTTLSTTAKTLQYERQKSQMSNIVFIPRVHSSQINCHSEVSENMQPNQIPPQIQFGLNSLEKGKQKQLQKKGKRVSKTKLTPEPEQVFRQLEEKKQLLQLGINSYLYKFGINGILKNDVVELLKQKWYEIVIDQAILQAGKSNELQKVICDFRDCFWQIDQSNKKLDYLLRQLRDKIKPQYVVKFILEKQFFKSFSTQSLQEPEASSEKISNSNQLIQQRQDQEQYQPSNHIVRNLNPRPQPIVYSNGSSNINQIFEEAIKTEEDLEFQLDI